MKLCCFQKITVLFIFVLFFVRNNAAEDAGYLKSCTMANLLVATRENQNRYAYGLTFDCTFFFFEMFEYPTFELAMDYYQTQHDLEKSIILCPADMFNVRYVPQNYTPYFEVLELKAGVSHYIPMENATLFFAHITPKSEKIKLQNWAFSPSAWATHYLHLLIHAKPYLNQRTGRTEIRTYIRHKTEKNSGACIKQSFSAFHLFQLHPLIGDEADDLKSFLLNGTSIPHRPILTNNAEYYFYAIIGVIIFAGISILIGIGLIIWKIVKYCSLENQRYEIEKFVVACYVEKLEKISKIPIGNEKPKSKKKKKRISPSESRSASYHSHHHHRRHRRRSQRSVTESVSKIPHGSKILPLPNEKDLFASDRKKVELKPVAIQEPRKEKTGRRDPSKGSNTSVCSLKSVTQSVDDSLDWTGKGVRVSQRKPALQLYKEDQTKDEDEAYKLGMNLSTFKRKKKRQQHGSQQDDEESKKKQKTQYPLSVVSGMSSYTKPMPPIATTVTATPVPPTAAPTTTTVATTNSKLLRGDQTAQDEARFQRAEKELQDRVEAQQKQQQAKNPGGGGRASVYLGNNNPYGSLSVPMGPPDVFPQNKK